LSGWSDSVADWADARRFSVEQVESARIKEGRRVLAKARRKGVFDADDLLRRCEEKDGRRRFPVHDLLGVRILVRSLNDVAALKRALGDLQARKGELYPLGNPEDFDLEDINDDPRPTGYRALHIDGSVTVRVAERDVTVPFELQVKTAWTLSRRKILHLADTGERLCGKAPTKRRPGAHSRGG
jgi:ppGpp synthetase/RelA/SpoT-type nucleotidyltranferase